MSHTWSSANQIDLASLATSEAARWFTLAPNRTDLQQLPDGCERIARALYDGLLAKQIRYSAEPFHPSGAIQPVRTPAEVLDSPREGTCLDLALVFCGLALANELLPLLIVLNGHAIVALSTTHGLRQWQTFVRPGRALFTASPLTHDLAALRKLVESGDFIAIECTGFAQSSALSSGDGPPEARGRVDGVMSFERATQAGREQLAARSLRFAIDIALAHYEHRIEPRPLLFDAFDRTTDPVAAHIRTAEFKALVDERTRHFVGRDFVFELIDRHLADVAFRSGYIVVSGHPGFGKTALMAALVARHGHVHHFNIAAENIRSARSFLSNVCAQLIVKYRLAYRDLPARASEDAGVLNDLLQRSRSVSGDTPVVVIVDGLDEAQAPDGPAANVLYLPRSLPDGVFFIVSSRPKTNHRLVVDRRRDIDLEADAPAPLGDAAAFVRRFIALHGDSLRPHLATWSISEADFVSLLAQASAGNFMYLSHVLDDMRIGRLTPKTLGDVRKLPQGLAAYYAQHWQAMMHAAGAPFARCHEPLLGVLAVARAPLAADEILDWARWKVAELTPADITRVIEDWREFLSLTPDGTHWRLYHASFREFVAAKVDTRPWHRVVMVHALACIAKAAAAANPLRALNGYQRDHVLAHAAAAGETAEVHRLLALETDVRANAWYEWKASAGRLADYRDDVLFAQRLAAQDARSAIASHRPDRSLGCALRYAALLASVNSLALRVPAPLLPMAVRAGLISLPQAVAMASVVPEPDARVRGWMALLPSTQDAERAALLDRLIDAIGRVDSAKQQGEFHATLAAQLTPADDSVIDRLLDTLPELENDGYLALCALAPRLDASRLTRAFDIARLIPHYRLRALALAAVAEQAPAAQRAELIEQQRQIPANEHVVCLLVASAARQSAVPAAWLDHALRAINTAPVDLMKAECAALLIPHVSTRLRARLVDEAHALIGKTRALDRPRMCELYVAAAPEHTEAMVLDVAQASEPSLRLAILIAVIPLLGEGTRADAMAMALDCFAPEPDSYLLKSLCALADRMDAVHARRALVLAGVLPDISRRVVASAPLLARLPAAEREDALDALMFDLRALHRRSIAEVMEPLGFQAREALDHALAALAPQVDAARAGQLWRMAQLILDEPWRTHGVLKVLDHIGEGCRNRLMASLLDVNQRLDPVQRVEALRMLVGASRLPRALHARARRQAFAIAQPALRLQAIAAVIPLMPERRRAAVLRALFQRALAIGPERSRAQTLLGVLRSATPALRRELAPAALDAAEQLDDAEQAARIVVSLLDDLPEDQALSAWQRAFEHADGASTNTREALLMLVPCAPEAVLDENAGWRMAMNDELDEVLAARKARAGRFDEEWDELAHARDRGSLRWSGMLAALIPYVSRTDQVDAALAWLDKMDNRFLRDELRAAALAERARLGEWQGALAQVTSIGRLDQRAQLLVAIAKTAPESERVALLRQALAAALEIADTDRRFAVHAMLAPTIAPHAHDVFLPMWDEVLAQWSGLSRLRLTHELFSYAPLMAALGGSEAVDDMVQAIDDAGRWWP